MKVYFSGGSPIVETSLQDPFIMLSYFVDAKRGKPTSRLRQLLALRRASSEEKRRAETSPTHVIHRRKEKS